MKKLLFFIFFVSIYGANIGFMNHADMHTILTTNPKELPHKVKWLKNAKHIFRLAKKNNKLIMVDISKTGCPPCQYLYDIVYQDSQIAAFINDNFIPAFYMVDKEKVPFAFAKYFNEVAPSILFITPDGKIFYKIIGARDKNTFFKLLKQVIKKYNNR
ncbi:disulfide isomerase [Nautilia sp. PV-1]|jgi:uncharacterized protein YyaL (SSP411 family)|uniref:thioredoxin family protein n=1 Tax=Nautilia sp. PV-1 TaxID=2579250 RepID=UPI000FDB230C|nr:DUF255 domain-containing protein [Nautilia sp. PV-1]AZV46977.1 disulfide isomerase [Nautilia sp. PV-1]